MEQDMDIVQWFSLRKSRSMPCLHTLKKTELINDESNNIRRADPMIDKFKVINKKTKVKMEDYLLTSSDEGSIFYEEPEPTLRIPQSLSLPSNNSESFNKFHFPHPNNVGFEKCFEFINAQCERGNKPEVVINKMSKVYEYNNEIRKNIKAIRMTRIHYIKRKLLNNIYELQRKRDITTEAFGNFLGYGIEGIVNNKKQRIIYETINNIKHKKSKKNLILKEFNKEKGLSTTGYQYFLNQMLNSELSNGFVCEPITITKQNEYVKNLTIEENYPNIDINHITSKDVITEIYRKLEDEIYLFEQKYQENKYLKKMNMDDNSSVNYHKINSIFIFSNYPALSFLSVVDPTKSNSKMYELLEKIINFYEGLDIDLEVFTESSETMRYADSVSIQFYDRERKECIGRIANTTNYLLTTEITSNNIPYIIYGYVMLLT